MWIKPIGRLDLDGQNSIRMTYQIRLILFERPLTEGRGGGGSIRSRDRVL